MAGLWAYGEDAGAVDLRELERMSLRLRPRGPDGEGQWQGAGGRIALAHRRLAIIEPGPGGEQPMRDPETGNVIVFNGEIYNHATLRAQLRRDGVPVRSSSDTEVLLKLWARDGAAMLTRLRGMFAFAIWEPARQRLVLARDAFGIKPLYLADDGRCLRFASQVKALLAGGAIDAAPSAAGHAGFLLWGSVPEPHTLYRQVRALPAGHWMAVETGRCIGPRRFDSPLLALVDVQAAGTRPAGPEALQHIAAAVHDSVAAHLVADVPVGVFLSAGLDSTMLAAGAARLGRVRTLTVGFAEFEGTAHDEAQAASALAARLGAEHSTERITGADFAADRAALLDAMDQPTVDGINTWFVAKAAARRGLKVALSGLGGDEAFGSYPSFHQVPALARLLAPAARAPALGRAVRRAVAPWAGALPSGKYAGLLEYGGTLAGAYLLRRALFMPWELDELLGPAMARQGLEELDTLASLRASIEGLERPRLALAALEMQWYMRHQLLRDADWAGMAHGVEIRVPFVDRVLIRQLRELRPLAPGHEKRLVAAAVAQGLPAEVLARPKTGFSVPVHQWLDPRRAGSGRIGRLREWGRLLHAGLAAG